jgi:hypothetical protein
VQAIIFCEHPRSGIPSASQIPIEYFVPLPKTATASPEVKDPDGAATASGTARRAVWLYELEAERSDFCRPRCARKSTAPTEHCHKSLQKLNSCVDNQILDSNFNM